MPSLLELLTNATEARAGFFDPKHRSAFRLFNGFTEGCPELVIDLYATTALIQNYESNPPTGFTTRNGQPIPRPAPEHIRAAREFLLARFPWLSCMVVKTRNGDDAEKRGVLVHGGPPDRKICENEIWYSIDLTLNRDASFYMDTRNLRQWAKENLRKKSVLNTFAYTGSLGVAALAGDAARVVQLDRNREFINQAKTSCTLNGLSIVKGDYLGEDFFPGITRLKKAGQRFDCVFLDPPFFSVTGKGRVDLEGDSTRLVNKLRPLVNDGGWLVVVNNALFVSGQDFMEELDALCADGHLQVEQIIPIPEDFTGFPQTRQAGYPADPAPFNHPTKIVILRVKHGKTNL